MNALSYPRTKAMKKRTPHFRKAARTLIFSFLILAGLPFCLKAVPTFVDICYPGDSYRCAVPLNKTYDYQWQISSKPSLGDWSTYTNISGATAYYYYFSPASYKSMYRVRCAVTIGFNPPVYSDPWEFTVYQESSPTPPTTVSVSGDNYCPNAAPATITLSCSGGSNYSTYQWFSSNCGSGSIGSGSTVTPAAPTSSKTYYVRSTSSGHCQPSSCATVVATVKTESVLPSQILASDNNICPGNSVTLSLDGGSLGTGAYWRWQVGTTYKGSGETHVTSLLNTTTTYNVQPYNGVCDGAFTPVVKEIVVNDVPVIPEGITAGADSVCVGGSTLLQKSGGEEGTSTSWMWYTGSCGGTFVGDGISHNTGDLDETTSFYLRGEDECGNTDCVSRTIVVVPLSIDTQPEDATVCVAGTASLSVSATGVGLQYQWKKDAVEIPGANSATYPIASAVLGDAGSYTCVVSDAENSVTSNAAVVTVLEQPLITTQPVSTNACYGETVQLEVEATVTEAATYQWKLNSVDIPGEDSSVIVFAGASPAMNGIYSCFIDDACGSVTSSVVNLTIYNQPPKIELGGDRLVCLNEEVELSAGLGYSSFLWSTGETTQNITVLNKDGDYYVSGTDVNGCEGFSDTVHISFAGPYQGSEICIVTVDSVTGKNMVVWEKTPDAGIESYNVWREGSTVNDSVLVQNVAFDALSVAVDEGSQPELKAHRYWITAIDSCGNESGRSNIHKTMLLTTGLGPDRINLTWLEYQVQGQPYLFVGYLIFRSPISSAFSIIDSIASGSPLYPDIDPPGGTNYYRIAGLINTPCEPEGQKKAGTGPYSHSLSNLDDNKLKETGVDPVTAYGKLKIYPNPFGDFTTLSFYNPGHSEYTLSIRDLSGKLVQTRKYITEQEIRIERGSLKAGYYHVELAGETIFRAKMIIQ